MKKSIAIVDNHIFFPRLIHSKIEKNTSAKMRAAINQDALPKRIFDAISVRFISLFLINSFGIAMIEVKMKYGINRYLPIECNLDLILNLVSLYRR